MKLDVRVGVILVKEVQQMENRWSTKEQLTNLLCELVRIPSISGSEAEKQLPGFVVQQLSQLNYFQENPLHLQTHATGDGRAFVTALVRSPKQKAKTVVLLSHFDVVEVDCYGEWQEYAFEAKKLTALFQEHKEKLPVDVQEDLVKENEWIFGRGTLDMKCGLALHMSLLEQASHGAFDGNILLLTVPDEEVHSVGMRAAIPALTRIAADEGLDYRMLLNSEPMDVQHGDLDYFSVELGSLGKVLPGFYCYGKETHAKEPFAGLNANYMAAEVTCELELDPAFCEQIEDIWTPPPTNLIQQGLAKGYSVTIPYRAVTMSNMFLLEHTLDDVIEPLLAVAGRAAKRIESNYHQRASVHKERELGSAAQYSSIEVKVLTYEHLYTYACQTYSQELVDQVIQDLLRGECDMDDRAATAQVIDELALMCKELGPMIVLFIAPPYYPPISSYENQFAQHILRKISSYAKDLHQIRLEPKKVHSAMTDLSYVGSKTMSLSTHALKQNMPLWEKRYTIPFKEMEDFIVPVLNLGPLGYDLHKWTERLNVDYAFGPLKNMLSETLRLIFSTSEVDSY